MSTDVQIFNKALSLLSEEVKEVTDVDGLDTSPNGKLATKHYRSTVKEEIRLKDWIFAIKRKTLALSDVVNRSGWFYAYNMPGAVAAKITATATGTDGITIPAGTYWYNGDVTYIQDADVVIAGGTATIALTCLSASTVGNLVNATVLTIETAITGVGSTATKTATTTTGVETESLRVIKVYTTDPIVFATTEGDFEYELDYQFKEEKAVIYCNAPSADPNPYVKYVMNVTDPTRFDINFESMLIRRLAETLCKPVTGDDSQKKDLQGEYGALLIRARAANALEAEDDKEGAGERFWIDR